MELKNYQELVLRDLDRFIENVLDTGNAARAYDKTWTDRGVRIGGANGFPLYNDILSGVPNVCFKVPTGGGKTILGCAALKHIFDAMGPNKKKVVVWLVPWETILTQTYSNFKNPQHFYRERLNRDFASKVEIYNKQQALSGANFNPSAVSDQLTVIVLSFDSIRSRKKDERKVYEENSNLMPFVHTFENRDEMIADVDDSSLMQVLNQLKPVVVIDESHNAQTDLSKEMIRNLNPSFVVELTATPKSDSNVISIVTAAQLKAENMVKLPVIAYNRPSVERVIVEAIDLRNALEEAAIRERRECGTPYIRPIVLFQAQPRNDEESVTFERLKSNLVGIGIPSEEIAIKTATINELSGVDLMSDSCKIRYIITINALKEGWDCPFAYVLASLANRSSNVDVEQILGRILRQPHQKKYESKILNMSYVLTSSSDFSATLDKILVGLNTSGFSRNDCRVVRTNTLDNLTEEHPGGEQRLVQGSIDDDVFSSGTNVDTNIFNIQVVSEELRSRPTPETQEVVTSDNESPISPNDNVSSLIGQALGKNEEYEEEVRESEETGTTGISEEMRRFSNVFLVKQEFKDELRGMRLPVFVYRQTGTLFDGEDAEYPISAEYLGDGFNLDAQPIPTNITTSTDNIYKVDVETNAEGSIVKKTILTRGDSDVFRSILSSVPEEHRVHHCKERLIQDLNIRFNGIPYSSIVSYVDRIVSSLSTEDEIVALQNNIYAISNRIKDFVLDRLELYRYDNFRAQLSRNEVFVRERYVLSPSITLPEHTSHYVRTLYEEEDARVNSLEERFMAKISSLPNVKWWHRNIERAEYAINGFINHYPDFIVKTNSGLIIFVETKGEHLDGDDSKKKLELGQTLANYAGPNKYKYFMAFDRSPLQQNGSDLLDNIIDTISRL